eukprot:8288494-Heterocapsa_arctica.AAC.1
MLKAAIPSLSPKLDKWLRADGIVSDSVLVGHNEWAKHGWGWGQRKTVTKTIGDIPVTDQSGKGLIVGN